MLSTAPDDGLDLVLYTSGTVLAESKSKFADNELETFSLQNNLQFTKGNLQNKVGNCSELFKLVLSHVGCRTF